MIDFSTLKSLTIPEGVVTQIADASGRVLWAVKNNEPIVLQVEKITSNTYANSTTYTGEQFIALVIYPKTSGTVTVTYGGLTRIITDTSGAEIPLSQEVVFGTFEGVVYDTTSPASGELIIEGDCVAFSLATFQTDKTNNAKCYCVKSVVSSGSVAYIPNNAFGSVGINPVPNETLTSVNLSNTIAEIQFRAFFNCVALKSIVIPKSVTSIGYEAFGLSEGYERTVIMQSATPPVLGTNSTTGAGAFDPVGTNRFIVPKGSGNAYKTAEGWSQYADYISEAS